MIFLLLESPLFVESLLWSAAHDVDICLADEHGLHQADVAMGRIILSSTCSDQLRALHGGREIFLVLERGTLPVEVQLGYIRALLVRDQGVVTLMLF